MQAQVHVECNAIISSGTGVAMLLCGQDRPNQHSDFHSIDAHVCLNCVLYYSLEQIAKTMQSCMASPLSGGKGLVQCLCTACAEPPSPESGAGGGV